VGLAVFLLLSRSGPLGFFGILFTPQAMVIAQTLFASPRTDEGRKFIASELLI
jgi:tungstate transport system permease protein